MIPNPNGPDLVVDEDGVIIDSAGINDVLAFIVSRRHEARQQAKEWEAYQKTLDAVLLKQLPQSRMTYGDVVVGRYGGTYSTTDCGAFAESLFELALEAEEMFEVISAAQGFTRDNLPEKVRQVFDDCTTKAEKRPWIQSSIARKLAPKVKREAPEGELEEQLKASVKAQIARKTAEVTA